MAADQQAIQRLPVSWLHSTTEQDLYAQHYKARYQVEEVLFAASSSPGRLSQDVAAISTDDRRSKCVLTTFR